MGLAPSDAGGSEDDDVRDRPCPCRVRVRASRWSGEPRAHECRPFCEVPQSLNAPGVVDLCHLDSVTSYGFLDEEYEIFGSPVPEIHGIQGGKRVLSSKVVHVIQVLNMCNLIVELLNDAIGFLANHDREPSQYRGPATCDCVAIHQSSKDWLTE